MKNRLFAAYLAFFGGVLGLHKMYLKGMQQGMGRLIFFGIVLILKIKFLIGLLFAISIIEGLHLASMSDEKFNRKYNSNASGTKASGQTGNKGGWFDRTPARALKLLRDGQKKFNAYDLKAALADFLQAITLAPNHPDIHFQLARTYAMMEDATKGFFHLEQAVACGLKDKGLIASDDSLAFLRIQPEYQGFVSAGFKIAGPPELDQGREDTLLVSLKRLSEQRTKGEITEVEFQQRRMELLRK